MSQGTRSERIGELIRNELSLQLTRYVRDPGVRHVTVTHVRMSKDLQQARVFYTGTEGEDPASRLDVIRALRRARPYLKRQLGQRLRLRRVPELVFEYDDSTEQQDRVARLFEQIASDRERHPPAEPES